MTENTGEDHDDSDGDEDPVATILVSTIALIITVGVDSRTITGGPGEGSGRVVGPWWWK